MKIETTGIKEVCLNDDGTLKIISHLRLGNQDAEMTIHRVSIDINSINWDQYKCYVDCWGKKLLPIEASCYVAPECDVYFQIEVKEEPPKEMSIQEIEEKLGHKIKIISK